jgi:predicted ribosome quality control (RQC) complex YloA/Tae2 family protein
MPSLRKEADFAMLAKGKTGIFSSGWGMDTFFIEAVVLELARELPRARVNKVHQPNGDDIILRLWTGRKDLRLLLSTSPTLSRIHLTEKAWPNPFTPPRFCQLLRSRLSVLTRIEQVPGERVVKISFRGKDGTLDLMAELVGRQSNIVLVDSRGKIVDALKRAPGGEGRSREILPGRPYRLPDRHCPIFLGEGSVRVPEEVREGADFKRWLLANVSPMSPLAAADLAAAVVGGLSPEGALALFRETWLQGKFIPLQGDLLGKRIISALAPRWISLDNRQEFSSLSEAADDFYYPRAFGEGDVGDRAELEIAVRKGLKRLASRMRKIEAEQKGKEDFEHQRRLAEILLANLRLVRKGMTRVTVADYFQDPPAQVTITLDPSLSPQENAEHYFKGFKKDKRGVDHIARRLEETAQETGWLEGVALALEEAETPGELAAVREELESADLIRPAPRLVARRSGGEAKPQVGSTTSPGGYQLFWGKNNRSNDYVTRRLTGPEDLWFHAHNLPGSHLVLRKGEKKGDIPKEDIEFAASLAAGHSRGKNDGKVEVMVTEGKWVRKAKGLPPGMVLVDRFRTLIVPPRRMEREAGAKTED